MRTALFAAPLAAAAVLAAAASARLQDQDAWSLDPDQSHVAFVSVKAAEIAEVHRFGPLSGGVSKAGTVRVVIDLSTVETGVDIRNERMREMFFETGTYPEATITADLDPAAYERMNPSERSLETIEISLSLHGATATMPADVFVTRVGKDRVLVETAEPIVVRAADFGLGEGVEALREVAGLPSIAPEVPVTASLVFERA